MASQTYHDGTQRDAERSKTLDGASWHALDTIPSHGGSTASLTHEYHRLPSATRATSPQADKGPTRRSGSYYMAWASEMAWLLVAVGLFAALAAVLATRDDKPMPEWPLGLTLNTAVAALATLCRAAAVIPVAEAVSQLKWNWFVARPRPLRDLYVFDKASRGPWGSIELLPRMRGRFILFGIMAAVALVSGLFTSFLTQSAISYSTRSWPSPRDDVVAPAARRFPPVQFEDGEEDVVATQGMYSAAFQGALQPINDSWPVPEPSCPSSSCTWPVFSSLGVCASVANVTEDLKLSNKKSGGKEFIELSLGGDLVRFPLVEKDSAIIGMVSPDKHLGRGEVGDEERLWDFPYYRQGLAKWENPDVIPATLSQFFVAYTTGDSIEKSSVRVAEVLWHLCVKTYNVTFDQGVSRTDTISTRVTVSDIMNDTDSEGVNHFIMTAADGKARFNVSQGVAFAFVDERFRSILAGTYSATNNSQSYSQFTFQLAINLLFRGGPTTLVDAEGPSDSAEEDEAAMWNTLDKYATTIADSMTAFMRKADKSGEIHGQSISTEVYVHVRWEWIALLAIQLGLSIILVLLVGVQTRKLDMDVIKSSNVAELFALEKAPCCSNHDHKPAPAGPRNDGDCLGHSSQGKGISARLGPHESGALVREDGVWKLKTL